jgi:hypothetical protein
VEPISPSTSPADRRQSPRPPGAGPGCVLTSFIAARYQPPLSESGSGSPPVGATDTTQGR